MFAGEIEYIPIRQFKFFQLVLQLLGNLDRGSSLVAGRYTYHPAAVYMPDAVDAGALFEIGDVG